MTFKVTFQPSGKTVQVEKGTIADAAKKAGIPIQLSCGGNGRCGRCAVLVNGETVLACRTQVTCDIEVAIPEKEKEEIIASTDFRDSVDEDFVPGKGRAIAVDIGTTTVAVDVIDLSTGETIERNTGINLQREKGEDVLARIQCSLDGETEVLRSLVLETINGLIPGCDDACKVCVSGNTVMEYLFLGKEPGDLRFPPFEPKFDKLKISGKESGLKISPKANVFLMPCVSSYVGGDITAGIVYSAMDLSDDLSLFIDVGTNGEVALGNREMMLVCSSSAGPAFEGSGLTSGMLASKGAIDSVRLEGDELRFTTIGGVKPKGICGSGIIDLVACLLRSGRIDRHGRFTGKANAKSGAFIITGNIKILQDELESIILTKAAVYSAARALVRKLGVTFDDVKHIYIAGGFGNFIDAENAIAIGMFPDVPREKYVYLGNASLAGARHRILSEGFRDRIERTFGMMTYVDLGSEHVFYDEYVSAQFLPHTDKTQFRSQRYRNGMEIRNNAHRFAPARRREGSC